MEGSIPQPLEKWLHYKGGVYQIVCMSKHTETNEELVIYTSDKSEQVFARPYSHWHEVVSKGFPVPRFRKIN